MHAVWLRFAARPTNGTTSGNLLDCACVDDDRRNVASPYTGAPTVRGTGANRSSPRPDARVADLAALVAQAEHITRNVDIGALKDNAKVRKVVREATVAIKLQLDGMTGSKATRAIFPAEDDD